MAALEFGGQTCQRDLLGEQVLAAQMHKRMAGQHAGLSR
jgi:hypothetical protein